MQKTTQTVQDDATEQMADMPQMAQRAMEEAESMGGAMETFAVQPTEPSFAIFWSVIAVLSVVIGWLIIEIIIKQKESKTT